jgi:hypothetical protein
MSDKFATDIERLCWSIRYDEQEAMSMTQEKGVFSSLPAMKLELSGWLLLLTDEHSNQYSIK